jgi:polysaccharide biosynthesis transport protein
MEKGTELTTIEAPRARTAVLPAPPMPASLDAPAGEGGGALTDLMRVLQRQRWKLLAFIGTALAAAVAMQFAVPRLFEATALVKIDRHQVAVITEQAQQQSGPSDDMDQIVTTVVELAKSDPVLRPVAERYNLLEVEKQTAGLKPDEIVRLREAPIELKRLKVTRPPNTYLLRITYRAHDPQLAAAVANAVAESLVLHANDSATRSMEQASIAIDGGLASLRDKMDKSDGKLASYQSQLGVVDPEQHVSIPRSQLVELNNELTAVQTERANREAVLQVLNNSGSLATAQAIDALRSIPDNTLNEAVVRLDAARQQFASARSFYGENHPEYAKARQQVEELTRQLNELVASAKDRANAALQAVKAREARLRVLVTAARAQVDGQQPSTLEYDRVRGEAESDRKLYESLLDRNMVAGINRQFDNATLQVYAEARPPLMHIFPKLSVDLPVALVLSTLLGVLAAVLANALDTTFERPEDVAEQLRIDVLAAVPATRQLPSITPTPPSMFGVKIPAQTTAHSTARFTEAILTLRTALNLAVEDGRLRSVAVTSALHGEGKSTTSAQLARAVAQVGKKVLLVEADMRRPTLHKAFEVALTPGLSEVLEGEQLYRDSIVALDPPGLFMLPAGPISRRAADLVSLSFSSILAKVSREFDLVLIDCPPVLGAAEAQEIAGMADGALLVIKASGTSGKAVSAALSSLIRNRAHVLGLVMNQVRNAGSNYSYYYYATGDKNNVRRVSA